MNICDPVAGSSWTIMDVILPTAMIPEGFPHPLRRRCKVFILASCGQRPPPPDCERRDRLTELITAHSSNPMARPDLQPAVPPVKTQKYSPRPPANNQAGSPYVDTSICPSFSNRLAQGLPQGPSDRIVNVVPPAAVPQPSNLVCEFPTVCLPPTQAKRTENV